MSEIIRISSDSVSGFLHKPEHAADDGLVLTHGAGSNCQAPLLIAVADAFASAGLAVLRCDLPFRQRRRFGPPSPASASADRSGLKDAVFEMRHTVSRRVFLGGHSYGGRQASILASDDPEICDGLVLLSYPLHPPNKPEQLRTAHFSAIRIPCLFVHGTSDPFGTIQELTTALEEIPSKTELIVIENAGHDLAKGRFDVPNVLVKPFWTLMLGRQPALFGA
ncbi:MAG: alpha/beta fold hydrolase [Acidobacteriaceae bacterium]|nr:alpha/beta fold hydrolase [Acidobacteriaceae bacterium]